MYEAACEGHLDICKLLYENGAQNDVWKVDDTGWTPYHAAAYKGHDGLVRWFVLQGALCADADSVEIEGDRIYPQQQRTWGRNVWRGNRNMADSCQRLVAWAKEAIETHSALVMFLLGALPPAPDTDQSRSLQCLSVRPGIRKHIGDFCWAGSHKSEASSHPASGGGCVALLRKD
jgi:hypothetical protein